MSVRRAICIAIDGLRASALGAYGNTWHPTPALDALASQSLLFDWMIAAAPSLEGFYGAAWDASPPLKGGARGGIEVGPLPRLLRDAGVRAELTTDDAWIAELAESVGFAEIRCLAPGEPRAAESVADTELGQLFALAADQLAAWVDPAVDAAENETPRLLWLHARGFHGAWDAPLALREELLDSDDPPAPTFLAPLARLETDDHDTLLLHRAAYAAQAMVLDECLGGLLAALAEYGLDRDTLVVLVGCRGFALGEHGAVGAEVRSLFSELLHLPCLIRLPGEGPPPPRSSQLVQPVDLGATLSEWFGATPSCSSMGSESLLAPQPLARELARRKFVLSASEEDERSLRTPAWMLREVPAAGEAPGIGVVGLYVKPDDLWEANEVADRCPEIVAGLLAAMDQAVVASDAVAPLPSAALAPDLVDPARRR